MSTVTPLVDNLFIVPTKLSLMGADFQRKAVIVRLPESDALSLISPVPGINDETLRAHGHVRHCVAPSILHDTGFRETCERFPETERWAVEGLAKPFRDLNLNILSREQSPKAWLGVIDVIPLQGVQRFQEHVLWHRPSRSLIVADLFFNIHPPAGAWTRLLFKMNGVYKRPGMSRVFRSAISNKAALRQSLEELLALAPERIVLCHGETIDGHDQAASILNQSITQLG